MDHKEFSPKLSLLNPRLGCLTQSKAYPRVQLTRLSTEELRPYLNCSSIERRHCNRTESKIAADSFEQRSRDLPRKRTCAKEIGPDAYTQEKISNHIPENGRCPAKFKTPVDLAPLMCNKKGTKRVKTHVQLDDSERLPKKEPTILSPEERSVVINKNKSKTIRFFQNDGQFWQSPLESHLPKEKPRSAVISLPEDKECEILEGELMHTDKLVNQVTGNKEDCQKTLSTEVNNTKKSGNVRVQLTRLSTEELRPYLNGSSIERRHCNRTESKIAADSFEQRSRDLPRKRTCAKEIGPDAYTREKISNHIPENGRCPAKFNTPVDLAPLMCNKKGTNRVKTHVQLDDSERLPKKDPTILSPEERSVVIDKNKSKTISLFQSDGQVWQSLLESHLPKERPRFACISSAEDEECEILEGELMRTDKPVNQVTGNKEDCQKTLSTEVNNTKKSGNGNPIVFDPFEKEISTAEMGRSQQLRTRINEHLVDDEREHNFWKSKSVDGQSELRELTPEEKSLFIDKNKTDTISYVVDQRNERNILFIRSLVQPEINNLSSVFASEKGNITDTEHHDFVEKPIYDLVTKVKKEPITSNLCGDDDLSTQSTLKEEGLMHFQEKNENMFKSPHRESFTVHSEKINVINIFLIKSESKELCSEVHISNPLEIKYNDLFDTEIPVKLDKGEFEVLFFKEKVLLLNKNIHEAVSVRRDQIDAKNNITRILREDSSPSIKSCLEQFCKQVEEIDLTNQASTRSSEETLLTDLVKMVKSEDQGIELEDISEQELNNDGCPDNEFILGFDEPNLFSPDSAQADSNINSCPNGNCGKRMSVRCYVCRQIAACPDLCQVGSDQIALNYTTPHYNIIALTCLSHTEKPKKFDVTEGLIDAAVCARNSCSQPAEIACLCKARAYCSHQCREEDWYGERGHRTSCGWKRDSSLLITRLQPDVGS